MNTIFGFQFIISSFASPECNWDLQTKAAVHHEACAATQAEIYTEFCASSSTPYSSKIPNAICCSIWMLLVF